jgi:hypothetical protein
LVTLEALLFSELITEDPLQVSELVIDGCLPVSELTESALSVLEPVARSIASLKIDDSRCIDDRRSIVSFRTDHRKFILNLELIEGPVKVTRLMAVQLNNPYYMATKAFHGQYAC